LGQDAATERNHRKDIAVGRNVSLYWRDGAWLEAAPNRLWRRHADAVHRELLKQWLPERRDEVQAWRRVLKTDLYEEAVGTGQIDWLVQRCELVAGIDLAPAVAAAAARMHSAQLHAYVADVRRLPFRDRSFDIILSLSTLDHFAKAEGIQEALAELARVLRPGGLLVLTLDNPANPIIKLRQALPFPLLRRLGLVSYYCGPTLHPRRVETVLQTAGFEVQHLTAILHCPRALVVPLAHLLDRLAPPTAGRAFLRVLRVFEHLGRLPSRHLTGYFVAARCVKTP
jgi:SAM-dependent methyltransferase